MEVRCYFQVTAAILIGGEMLFSNYCWYTLWRGDVIFKLQLVYSMEVRCYFQARATILYGGEMLFSS
jgi:ABC-type transport system involved in cytochrome c biogenesis permease subunit